MSQNARIIIKKLKTIASIKSDSGLAEALGVKANAISMWKSRDTLNYPVIIAFCDKNDIDLNHILSDKDGAFENAHLKTYPNAHLTTINEVNSPPREYKTRPNFIPIISKEAITSILKGSEIKILEELEVTICKSNSDTLPSFAVRKDELHAVRLVIGGLWSPN